MKGYVFTQLPLGYICVNAIDFRKNLKITFSVNFFSVIAGLIMFITMNYFIPYGNYFDSAIGKQWLILRKVILILSLLFYIVLHEYTHGWVMKCFGAKTVHYGFTGLYAYTSCQDYMFKKAYYVVSLAPLFLWGVAFLIGCFLAKQMWLILIFYWLQIVNVAGSVGDMYIVLLLRKYPEDTLINDEGTNMCFYTKINDKTFEKEVKFEE